MSWLRDRLRAWLLPPESLESRVAFLEETCKSHEQSIRSLVDGKLAPEEKKEDGPLRTPRPKAWHERRDEFIASRKDPQFITKLMSKKDG